MHKLTQEQVQSFLNYNPESGVFVWKIRARQPGDVAGWKDKKSGYIKIKVARHSAYAHQLAWLHTFGEWPSRMVDHINQNKADNRIANLRLAGPVINGRNQKLFATNTSGVCGVAWHKHKESWVVQIMGPSGREYLGSFKSLFDAACARKSAERRIGYSVNHGRSL